MTKTTAKPRFNVLEVLPELAGMVKTTTRIHPRRGEVQDIAGSKIGGKFLWPANEKWPTMPSKRPKHWVDFDYEWSFKWDFPDGTEIELTPVLQINQKDAKDFPFPKGTDLFQLFWLPLDIDKRPYFCPPHVVWRSTKNLGEALSDMPFSPHVNPNYVPNPCYLTFESVEEYPDIEDLNDEQQDRLSNWVHSLHPEVKASDSDEFESIDAIYQFELSVCPSSKLGGYVGWIQAPEWPDCDCGHRMEHLLTLTDCEVDAGTWIRWLPLEDRELYKDRTFYSELVNAPNWSLGGGSMYYFVCRHCENWPVKVVYQR
jgi:hypothetical protein